MSLTSRPSSSATAPPEASPSLDSGASNWGRGIGDRPPHTASHASSRAACSSCLSAPSGSGRGAELGRECGRVAAEPMEINEDGEAGRDERRLVRRLGEHPLKPGMGIRHRDLRLTPQSGDIRCRFPGGGCFLLEAAVGPQLPDAQRDNDRPEPAGAIAQCPESRRHARISDLKADEICHRGVDAERSAAGPQRADEAADDADRRHDKRGEPLMLPRDTPEQEQ